MIKPVPFKIDIPKQILQNGEIQRNAFVCADSYVQIVDPEEVRKKKVTIPVRGFIKYTGIHLSEKDPPYTTTFAYDWIPVEYPDSPDFGYWQESGENQAT